MRKLCEKLPKFSARWVPKKLTKEHNMVRRKIKYTVFRGRKSVVFIYDLKAPQLNRMFIAFKKLKNNRYGMLK